MYVYLYVLSTLNVFSLVVSFLSLSLGLMLFISLWPLYSS